MSTVTQKLVRAKIGPGGPLFAAKIGPTPDHFWLPKVVRIAKSGPGAIFINTSSTWRFENMDDSLEQFGEAVFQYLSEKKYPSGSDDTFKRIIRKKAAMFVIREGVIYFKKKKRGKVRTLHGHYRKTIHYLYCV